MDDQYFMKKALGLAEKGRGFTSPNPMVGAVVVQNDSVVGKGYHEVLGGAHAEVNAIKDAGQLVKGATLYVTLEPCNHTGKTPPCTKKVLESGISRIVVAMKDPNPEVKGGGIDYLKTHGVSITLGVCEDEAKKLNEAYLKYIITRRPFVTVKCASTLDGQIATRTGDSKWVTGEASRKFVHMLRHAVDAIMVGTNTVKKDNPSLTTRLEDFDGRDPTRVILDAGLSISHDAKVLRHKSHSDTIIVIGDSTENKQKKITERPGVRIVKTPLKDDLIDLDFLMDQLGAMEISSLLIEGGSRVIASAFSSGIVDKVMFFFAPKILGGDDGVPICAGKGPALMSECISMKDISMRRFDNDIMIEGYI
jgi:diaminohydroxyphosphoribosylaminopyrimidine deaminase/5-amino-6-(5-phosphoribosylamino)uracil reductase